jgi:hypothetical protein
MKLKLMPALVGAGLTVVAASASAQGTSEIEALRGELNALQAKIEQLERQQKAQAESADKTTDAVAQVKSNVGDWVGRFQWKGDLRYRNETIDQEFALDERNRDRIRLRAGFVARVNDTVRAEVQATTTEGSDPRSSNQTLTNTDSRKALDLDTAFFEWAPNASFRTTLGKMRYPWVRTSSYFFDGDVNPEGIALGWQRGATGPFANAFYMQLMERSTAADSNLAGAQLGWRMDITGTTRLMLAASYFAHGAVEGYNAVLDGNVAANNFGNTTTNTLCRVGLTACIANDFDIVEGLAELSTSFAGKPFTFFVDYARNTAADFPGTTENDTAYAAGFLLGRVSGARTWEIGYTHQKVEKDALYGQWIDSDFANGLTDGEGGAIRLGYGFGRNFRVNGTYFMTETNMDVPTTIAGVGPVTGRDYERLQLDLNVSF